MTATATALPASFYARPVVEVARDLLGCVLVHGECAGVIVETEAYHDSEAACHAHVGLTPRTHVLFGPPGDAYVYRSYGIHALLNAVAEPEGTGAAVLIPRPRAAPRPRAHAPAAAGATTRRTCAPAPASSPRRSASTCRSTHRGSRGRGPSRSWRRPRAPARSAIR